MMTEELFKEQIEAQLKGIQIELNELKTKAEPRYQDQLDQLYNKQESLRQQLKQMNPNSSSEEKSELEEALVRLRQEFDQVKRTIQSIRFN